MKNAGKIKNSELLINAFGRFPTFHDAEVVQIILDKGDWQANRPPNLLAKLQVLKLVSKEDGNGNLLWSRHLVTMRFSGIEDLRLGNWQPQNVLWDLLIEEILEPQTNETKFEVRLDSIPGVGLSAEFKCIAIEVASVGSAERIKNAPVDEKTQQERMNFVEEYLRKVRSNKSKLKAE
ncbi:MAG: hypothetical protein HY231_25195 [Acidobacteria bacterium]|nr:hypothetical protein [Acidobacteriota bacterium]